MSTVTKIFVVLQVLFALTLSVLVVLFAYKQQNYRAQLVTTQNSMVAASAALAKQDTLVAQTQAELSKAQQANVSIAGKYSDAITNLQAKLQSANTQIAQAAADQQKASNNVTLLTDSVTSLQKQLADETAQLNLIRPELLKAINENAQLNRHNDNLTNERNEAQKTIQTLQESIANLNARLTKAMSAAKSPTQTASLNQMIGVPTASPVNGIINQVESLNGHTYVSFSLGARDGVTTGTRLTVYRNGTYVADIVVRSVDPTQSVGVVTLVKPGQSVKTNDTVMSGPGT